MTTNRTATPATLAGIPTPRVRSRQRGQLTLLAGRGPWHLDERTRRVGRAGVAEARATLQAARQRELERAGDTSQAA